MYLGERTPVVFRPLGNTRPQDDLGNTRPREHGRRARLGPGIFCLRGEMCPCCRTMFTWRLQLGLEQSCCAGGRLAFPRRRARERDREREAWDGGYHASHENGPLRSTDRGYSRIRKCTALGSCGGARSRSMGPLSGRCVSLFASDPCKVVHSGWSTHM